MITYSDLNFSSCIISLDFFFFLVSYDLVPYMLLNTDPSSTLRHVRMRDSFHCESHLDYRQCLHSRTEMAVLKRERSNKHRDKQDPLIHLTTNGISYHSILIRTAVH